MRRIHTSAAVLLGLALAVLPAAGFAADQPSSVVSGDDCGAGAGSTTVTAEDANGTLVTITTDNFGDCLEPVSNPVSNSVSKSVSSKSSEQAAGDAAPAVPVPGRPAFTG